MPGGGPTPTARRVISGDGAAEAEAVAFQGARPKIDLSLTDLVEPKDRAVAADAATPQLVHRHRVRHIAVPSRHEPADAVLDVGAAIDNAGLTWLREDPERRIDDSLHMPVALADRQLPDAVPRLVHQTRVADAARQAVAREEIFGPVVTVIPFDTEQEAVAIANDTPYGLAGSLWTRDGARQLRVARALRTGVLGVNTNSSVFAQTPFGGYKQSGVGKELGMHALEHNTELKSVFISTE